jgi:N-acetylmuramoyl-L-alanine amidase
MARVKFVTRKTTKYIVVHCAATKPTMDIGVREIRQWHQQQGWLDVGYHFVIRRNGMLEVGRDLDAVGSHVKGHNHESIGICLAGGIDAQGTPEDNFTAEQYAALDGLIFKIKAEHYPDAKVIGHRDLDPGKACPSFSVAKWLQDKPKDI